MIIGSPRKMGNSYKIVKRIEERIRTPCLSVGDDRCPLKDDREAIEKQMLDADGVIFVSPMYAMNVTALIKNFLDRFAYTLHSPRFFRQKAMIACTTGALGLKETIDRLSVIMCAGFDLVHTAGFYTPESNVSLKSKSKIDKGIEYAANKFFEAFQNKQPPSPKLTALMPLGLNKQHLLHVMNITLRSATITISMKGGGLRGTGSIIRM